MDSACTSTPVTKLKGIGPKRAEALSQMGITTVLDLAEFLPRSYENRAHILSLSRGLSADSAASFILTVATAPQLARIRKSMNILKFRAFDESGSIDVVFFNCPFLKTVFLPGMQFRFYGKLTVSKARKVQLLSPKFERYTEGEPLPAIIPLYRIPDGFSQKSIAAAVREALMLALPSIVDVLPPELREAHHLPEKRKALLALHDPTSEEALAKALRRTVFEEIYFFALGLSLLRKQEERTLLPSYTTIDLAPFLSKLPYTLTGAQKRAVNDLFRDMCRGKQETVPPMTRILVGDVGSGKTVVAAAAMYLTAKNGRQCALMVPTEILAQQHYEELSPLFASLGLRTALLVGSMTKKQKDAVYSALECDEGIDILIGTHALLNERVKLSRLGLTITDEQHRFGVMQRAALKQKSAAAHLLVMSATPIPRTLALTMYGDLDLSLLDEMPPNRQRVDTFVVNSSYQERLRAFMQKEVEKGGQVYVVCPAIDDGDNEESLLLSATTYAKELEKALPSLRIALLHGRMKNEEREKTMRQFACGEIDILVSTTVIEVGVNVPNASLMVIENADRFGLSQLHQLRGRVGRGTRKSYCVLVSDTSGEAALARLETIRTTYDGYRIAEADLAQRGPGDFFSSMSDGAMRQSGGLTLKSAHLCNETALMESAFAAAKETLRRDPTLSLSENRGCLAAVNKLFAFRSDTLS